MCPFCHLSDHDTLSHFHECSVLLRCANHTFKQHYTPPTRQFFFLTAPYNDAQLTHLSINALHIFCSYQTYHRIRHNNALDPLVVYQSTLHQIALHDHRISTHLRIANSTQLWELTPFVWHHPQHSTDPIQPFSISIASEPEPTDHLHPPPLIPAPPTPALAPHHPPTPPPPPPLLI
jgi:hypothetical protein